MLLQDCIAELHRLREEVRSLRADVVGLGQHLLPIGNAGPSCVIHVSNEGNVTVQGRNAHSLPKFIDSQVALPPSTARHPLRGAAAQPGSRDAPANGPATSSGLTSIDLGAARAGNVDWRDRRGPDRVDGVAREALPSEPVSRSASKERLPRSRGRCQRPALPGSAPAKSPEKGNNRQRSTSSSPAPDREESRPLTLAPPEAAGTDRLASDLGAIEKSPLMSLAMAAQDHRTQLAEGNDPHHDGASLPARHLSHPSTGSVLRDDDRVKSRLEPACYVLPGGSLSTSFRNEGFPGPHRNAPQISSHGSAPYPPSMLAVARRGPGYSSGSEARPAYGFVGQRQPSSPALEKRRLDIRGKAAASVLESGLGSVLESGHDDDHGHAGVSEHPHSAAKGSAVGDSASSATLSDEDDDHGFEEEQWRQKGKKRVGAEKELDGDDRGRILPPRKKRVRDNWTAEEDRIFFEIVQENRSLPDMEVTRILATRLGPRRTYQQVKGHLKNMRAAAKI